MTRKVINKYTHKYRYDLHGFMSKNTFCHNLSTAELHKVLTLMCLTIIMLIDVLEDANSNTADGKASGNNNNINAFAGLKLTEALIQSEFFMIHVRYAY